MERGGEVIKGTLEMLVLRVLQLGPMHGWGITEVIERQSARLLSVNQGSRSKLSRRVELILNGPLPA